MTPDLSIAVFADGASIDEIDMLTQSYGVKGFTTNPTLMASAGVKDYLPFARKLLFAADGRPVSFEVFADDHDEMYRQALILNDLGPNVYVKIPITTTSGEFCTPVMGALHREGVKVNATAVFTSEQVKKIAEELTSATPAVVSIFAGRIADAGIDPEPLCTEAVEMFANRPRIEVLWASCREIFNVLQAQRSGCDIVTVPFNLLPKLLGLGRSLEQFSLETVRMFFDDAELSGFVL
jgi:transaldolase